MQGSQGDMKTWKMKIDMEKSWNMKNWPKLMEFCDQSWNSTNFTPNFIKFVFFVTTKKLSRNLESPHFLTFSAKCCECEIRKGYGHGKLRNGHGRVMKKSWTNILS